MSGFISNSPLARDLIRIGDEAIAVEDDVKLRDYFTSDYRSTDQVPTSASTNSAYFASLRAAFSGLRLVREQIIVDRHFLGGADQVLW